MAKGSVDPSVIQRIPTFAGLDAAEQRTIAAMATEQKVSAGTVLFREADAADVVYFVISGRASLSMRVDGPGELLILSVGPGELVGWSALLGGQERVATVRIAESGALLRLPGQELRDLCERDCRVGYAVMKQLSAALAQRLTDTRLQLLDMFGKPEAR